MKKLEKLKFVISELKKDFDFEIIKNFNKYNIILNESAITSLKFIKKDKKIIININDKQNLLLRLIYETFDKSFDQDFEIKLSTYFSNLSFMIDMARNNVMTIETLKKLIRILSLCGYNTLKLYLEDVFEVVGEPYFGYKRGKYSKKELSEIIEYAEFFNINIVPCIQTLTHLNCIAKLPSYRDIFDIDDILEVNNPRTYELIEHIFMTIKNIFKTNIVNIGMDEAHNLGRGKYLDHNGYKDRTSIFLEHLDKVLSIAKKYGFTCEMRSDMYFSSTQYAYQTFSHIEKINIPKDLKLVFWEYRNFPTSDLINKIDIHKSITKNIAIAGGVWGWLGFVPNNSYAIENINNFMNAGISSNIREFMLTSWGDNGGETSVFSSLLAINYAGNKNIKEVKDAKNHLFYQLSGYKSEEFATLDLLMKCDFNYDEINLNNLNRVYLFNDVLLGLFDSNITDEQADVYKDVSKRLNKLAKKPSNFNYLFRLEESLAKVLSLKVNLGIRLRKAYKEDNFKELANIENDIEKTIVYLEEFYNEFYNVWHKEAKSQGFDVQDLRFGGLKQRLLSTIHKLQLYLSGKISKIDELEENVLDYYGGEDNFNKNKNLIEMRYQYISTNNVNY